MDINTIIKNANPDIVIFLLTTLIALLSWIVKGLVEKPVIESKDTFNKFFEKRIEVLAEVKTKLNFIAYFPNGDDSLNYKEQLQTILLSDGRTCYLNKDIYDNVLKISIDKNTVEDFLIETINMIDKELYLNISKIQDEIEFYRKYSNYKPLRRFIGITLLSLQYMISLIVVISILIIMIIGVLNGCVLLKIGIIIIGLLLLYFFDKWLKR